MGELSENFAQPEKPAVHKLGHHSDVAIRRDSAYEKPQQLHGSEVMVSTQFRKSHKRVEGHWNYILSVLVWQPTLEEQVLLDIVVSPIVCELSEFQNMATLIKVFVLTQRSTRNRRYELSEVSQTLCNQLWKTNSVWLHAGKAASSLHTNRINLTPVSRNHRCSPLNVHKCQTFTTRANTNVRIFQAINKHAWGAKGPGCTMEWWNRDTTCRSFHSCGFYLHQ